MLKITRKLIMEKTHYVTRNSADDVKMMKQQFLKNIQMLTSPSLSFFANFNKNGNFFESNIF